MRLRALLSAGALALAAALPAGARTAWKPVTPEDLAATPPAAEPDAAALALDWQIRVDDGEFPRSRETTEYIRYKIFNPEKAVAITRLSEISASYNGETMLDADIRARLTLPDGTAREFGKESIQERTLAATAETGLARLLDSGNSVKERFLAVSGLEAGAILDLQITREQDTVAPVFSFSLQKSVPIRRLRYEHRLAESVDFFTRAYIANGSLGNAHLESDKGHSRDVITATDVPGIVNEPFGLPRWDRTLTFFLSIGRIQDTYRAAHVEMSLHVRPQDGPWATFTNRDFMLQEDAVFPTGAVESAARQITAGAATEQQKAAKIHRYVQALYVRFVHAPNSLRPPYRYVATPLSEVMAFDRFPREPMFPEDFSYLEIGLDRAAGMAAQTALLADKRRMHFNPSLASDIFLPERVVRVKCDGQWHYSYSTTAQPLAFGFLPWYLQNEPALLVQKGPQQFDATPEVPADQSTVRNAGEFTLGDDGSLSGDGAQILTGNRAMERRAALMGRLPDRRANIESRRLRALFGPDAKLRVSALTGVEQFDRPLEIHYHVEVPQFAVSTKHRMIFKPALFHANAASPFTASVRHTAVFFPFPWQEIDEFTLHFPEGLKLEDPSAPQSFPGDRLSYNVDMAYNVTQHWLKCTRRFRVDLEYVPLKSYDALKQRFDVAARGDSHELVLLRP